LRFDITGIIEDYPDIHIGVLFAEGINNNTHFEDLYRLQQEAIEASKEKIGDQPPTKHPNIASWRDLYRSFGTKPGNYRPSAEALVRRVIKTGKLPRINTAVDLYNLVSVKHIIPMGGFDIEQVDGDIYLRRSPGGEKFLPLGASQHEETYEREVVYADHSRILTRRWNYRDTEETKINENSENIVLFIDASAQIPREKVVVALDELEQLLSKACGGSYRKHVAQYDDPVISD
jgi:DNA/RNA-binding domain of Phe-tRNA-synthetase-like protein